MSTWLKNLKIQYALIGIITIAMLILAFATNFVNNRMFTSVTKQTIESELLSNQLLKVEARILSELNIPIGIARGMSQTTFLRKWVADKEPESQRKTMLEYLNELKTRNNAVTAYWVSNVSNNYYNEEGILTQLDPAEDTWFFDFLKSGRDYKVSLNYDAPRNTTLAFVDFIARDGSKVLGVAGIGYSVDAASKAVLDNKVGEEGYVFVTSTDGTILIHRDSADMAENMNVAQLPGMATAAKNLLEGDSYHFVQSKINGIDSYIASVSMEELGWKVFAVLPVSEPLGPVRSVLWRSALLNAALAIGFILIMIYIAQRITRPIVDIGVRLQDMAKVGGDLTHRLDASRGDELGQLAQGFNAIIHKVNEIMVDIKETEGVMTSSFADLRSMAEEVNECVNGQQQEAESVATATTEMTHSISEVSALATSTAERTENTHSQITQANGQVQTTNKLMQQLNDSNKATQSVMKALSDQTQTISSVVDTISSISEQTNLLALNAAIEAARAGEQGRGFAVVADEVRSLASRTQESTTEIKEVIERLQTQALNAVDAMDKNSALANEGLENTNVASQSLQAVVNDIQEITNMNTQVATATQQQSSVISELSSNVTRIADMANTVADLSNRTKLVVQELDQQKEKLGTLVSQFKTQ
ncbi:methyl-accepting chemotaxis protein [Reinekea sp. G2M2-21]|uniref:methyl-accepting chemotaxis protein n=1 Tax=Reinekea sp. G2M2-21 TaxID=2788942 RepID=UPI0018A8C2EA|nr:methyl-accepting chemotaxis protein [Reinekea sp. G2M2-21]